MKDRTAELRRGMPLDCEEPGEPAERGKRTTSWYDSDMKSELLPVVPKKSQSQSMHNWDVLRIVIKTHKIIQPTNRRRKSSRAARKADGDIFVESLRKQMSEIEDAVRRIQSNTRHLAELHTSALISPSPTEEDQTRMDSLERDTRAAFTRANSCIKDLGGAAPPSGSLSSTLQKMHSTQLFHARQSLSRAMERHEAELKRYADGLRKLIAKQISIARGASPDGDDVDNCIEEGHLQFFIDNYHAKEQAARTMLADVSERHRELAELEKSIVEVSHLFNEVLVLVLRQGDMLDSIEAHVLTAADEVTDGRKQLKNAKKKQKSARKKKVMLATVGAGVAAALVTTLALL